MPITFKNSPAAASGDHEKTFAHLHDQVADLIKPFAPGCKITVGMNQTYLDRDGLRITLPIGVPQIKNGGASIDKVRAALTGLFKSGPSAVHLSSQPVKAIPIDPNTDDDDMWAQHIATTLFPGTIALHKATALYQPVNGTNSKSVYKTCLIGPHLRVAARLKGSSVSFRATTDQNTCPEGATLGALQRLGLTSVYTDRITGHSTMTGPYDHDTAAEYRALFGAFYAALRPWLTCGYPDIGKLTQGVN